MLFYLTKTFYMNIYALYFKLLKLILSELLCNIIVSQIGTPWSSILAVIFIVSDFCLSFGKSDIHILVRVPHMEYFP